MSKLKKIVIPPRGDTFEVTLDLRDGQIYVAHMTLRDCPLARQHDRLKKDVYQCSICNGTSHFLRFEFIRSIGAIPSDPSLHPDRTDPKRPPTILQAVRKDQSKDTKKD